MSKSNIGTKQDLKRCTCRIALVASSDALGSSDLLNLASGLIRSGLLDHQQRLKDPSSTIPQ